MHDPAAIRYLYSFLNFERLPFEYRRQFNLKRMSYLLGWFGHPEQKFPSVLIAGTKGKGSTANFLASILAAGAYRTGLYTSPHLSDPRERIQIDGRMIPKTDFARVMAKIKPVLARRQSQIASYGPITFFEVFTLLAIKYFAEKKVDLAVFEVGMGGRLDATNLLSPLVSVITPISFDHEEHLGRKLSLIAAEKAAIIKGGGFVVSGKQPLEAKRVIQRQIKKHGGKGYFLGSAFWTRQESISLRGARFDFECHSAGLRMTNLHIQLAGRFQIQNAAVALGTAGILEQKFGFRLPEVKIREGLKRAFWPGRFEIVRRSGKVFVIDGAHNGASMAECALALKTFFPQAKKVVLFGTSREKDLKAILRPLLSQAACFIVTRSNNPRAQEPKVILEALRKMGYSQLTFCSSSLEEALKLSGSFRGQNTVSLVTGSLFLVAEAREWLKCRKFV